MDLFKKAFERAIRRVPHHKAHAALGCVVLNIAQALGQKAIVPQVGVGIVRDHLEVHDDWESEEIADFDGDGQLDIATVNGNVDAGTGSITILNGLSDGGFVAVNDFATRLNGPRVIQAADFLDDGGALPWIAVAYSSLTNANVVDVYKSPCAPAP